MAKKQYTIIKHRRGNTSETTGTIEELTEYFGYTLEVGKSWEHERGNRKVNLHPKTGKQLVTSLNNATNNAAANGYSGTYYELKEEQK